MVAEDIVRGGQIIAVFWRLSLADLLLDSISVAREESKMTLRFFAWAAEKDGIASKWDVEEWKKRDLGEKRADWFGMY